MDPALLKALREQSGLRLDREGRFWHRGGLVEHARTLAVLHQGIHRADDGRWATRIGKEWGYLEVEDAALWIRRVEPGSTPPASGEVPGAWPASDGAARAQLASGEWVEFDPATLASGDDDALYIRVRGERARLTRAAQLALSDALHEEPGGFSLELSGRRYRIGRDTGPEPVRKA